MSAPTHTDIHRDIGRMEGRLDAVEDRLSKIEAMLERIDQRLAKNDARESERKGAWSLVVLLASLASIAVGWVLNHFWK